MLIDELLPDYDVAERHWINIRATASRVYAVVRTLDLSESLPVRCLFYLRELPALLQGRYQREHRLGLTLNDLMRAGFVLLGERPDRELVLGLVGRFWTASGDIQRLDAAGFRAFRRPGFAKAVWNFSLFPQTNSITRLATETRVYCLDDASRRKFRLYWRLIRPVQRIDS